MYKNVKLLVADIDSTLRPKDGVSKRTVDTIEKLRDKGYLFGLASGRPVEDVKEMYRDWGVKEQFDFIISWNGCQLYDNGTETLYKYNYLTKDEIKEIIEFMRPFDTVLSIYKPGIYLCNKENEKTLFSAWKSKRKFVTASTEEDFYKEDCGGIMFRTSIEIIPRIEEKIAKELKGKNYIGFKTQPDLIEFSNKDCNKGFALKKYCELKNIALDDCMAFGDTTNDNEMLKICHGVCLLNGSDDTKACAEFITDLDCDNDGWADFIYKHLLSK